MGRPRIYANAAECTKAWKERNPERNAEQRRRSVQAWKDRHPDRVEASKNAQRARYGLPADELVRLEEEQGGACAICRIIPVTRLHIDHDHVTGAVRGLLCRNCNMALGLFHDDADALTRAVAYLGGKAS
jgi:hypothetical protein